MTGDQLVNLVVLPPMTIFVETPRCIDSGTFKMKNLFADIPQEISSELIQTLATSDRVRIERIVSYGHASPDGFWFNQDQHEWVVVLKGAARLRFADETVEMKPGDFVNIPAHRKHRVEWTSPDEPTIWLAVHYEVAK